MKHQLYTQAIETWIKSEKKPLLIAGPCSAETEAQVLETAKAIKKISSDAVYRAGVWKPRTRPDAFEGIGEEALAWLIKVKEETGLKVATEVANAKHTELCLKAGIDVLWIGARTSVNPFYVQEIADALKGVKLPVMIKNPINPDIQLWIGALERMNKAGIDQLAAIHRGFSSNEGSIYRNDPKWDLLIEFKSHLPEMPVICDPSHICGNREMIAYVAQRSLDLEAVGLMIETHVSPDTAWSDAKQQITPETLNSILQQLVVRESKTKDPVVKDKLKEIRSHIDLTDEKLIHLLHNRMQWVEKIGAYKRENKVTILQTNRWNEIQENIIQHSDLLGLNKEWIIRLYKLIHEESIRKQNEMMNS